MDTDLALDPALADGFPGFGRRYMASFSDFRFELHFESPSSLTWAQIGPEGNRGRCATVAIQTEAVTGSIHVVTWQEHNGTTVVQVEDFARRVVLTHVSRPDRTFIRARGTFDELPPPA